VARLRSVQHDDRSRWSSISTSCALAISSRSPRSRSAFGLCFWQNHEILDWLNEPLPGRTRPLTLGVTEPFMTTLTVSAYAGLLVALPVILYQLYAFVLPAFSPSERRFALPLLVMVPACSSRASRSATSSSSIRRCTSS
jgi:Sec-independent protein secretion pathway component TatC